MEEVFPILIGLFVCAMIGIGVAVKFYSDKSANDAWGRLAQQYGGRAQQAGWFSTPAMHFHHHGVSARVDTYSTGGKHPTYYTQMHIDWPDQMFNCEVYPEGFFHQIGKLFGMGDIEIGSPAFDADYIITGNRPEALPHVLNPQAQQLIGELRSAAVNGDVYINISGGVMMVKRQGWLSDYAGLEQFTRTSLALYDAMLVNPGDVQFVEKPTTASPDQQPPQQPAQQPVCQVCGNAIEDETELVRCYQCDTPHHRDCWNYNGKCSTYGCGEMVYR